MASPLAGRKYSVTAAGTAGRDDARAAPAPIETGEFGQPASVTGAGLAPAWGAVAAVAVLVAAGTRASADGFLAFRLAISRAISGPVSGPRRYDNAQRL